MEEAESITKCRLEIWNEYHKRFKMLEDNNSIRRPIIPTNCAHNAHMYYLLLPSLEHRTKFIQTMKSKGINCVFHYVALHSSPAGLRYCRSHGSLNITNIQSERLVRLPIFFDITELQQNHVIDSVKKWQI
jgi:dTDP-4-amino-4,6-dideoxygalactose transaminase